MIEQVKYDVLDRAKNIFIKASKSTLDFARPYGFVPDARLGASANVFFLDLKPFLKSATESLSISLVTEGLGTADDARPNDLTTEQLRTFWHNIAVKTVSCMTNDAACTGLQTILISLYLPSGDPELTFDETFLTGFVEGFVTACKTVGCVWISGETPQLKGKFTAGSMDIAGAVFGLLPPGRKPIDATQLAVGNKILFVESSGPHENGFTALRKIASELPQGYHTKISDGVEFWQAINAPSVLYTPLIQKLLAQDVQITNIENITGHGWQKLMRPAKPFCYRIDNLLPFSPVFTYLEQYAGWKKEDMLKIFNCGTGCALFVRGNEDATQVVTTAKSIGLQAIVAGVVESSEQRRVHVKPFDLILDDREFSLRKG